MESLIAPPMTDEQKQRFEAEFQRAWNSARPQFIEVPRSGEFRYAIIVETDHELTSDYADTIVGRGAETLGHGNMRVVAFSKLTPLPS